MTTSTDNYEVTVTVTHRVRIESLAMVLASALSDIAGVRRIPIERDDNSDSGFRGISAQEAIWGVARIPAPRCAFDAELAILRAGNWPADLAARGQLVRVSLPEKS